MNASGYLKGQGWRGEGHSLDTTNRGLSRPLLVTHKVDLAGLGTKKNDFGNQWWMDSFDKSLKGAMKIQIAKPVDLPRLKGFKYGNLYTNFVHAETLESTIKKDDFLYGKAFSDTKPMAEDPQTMAQRRLSQSTVAPGIVLGLEKEETNAARPKKRKAEVREEDESSSKKARKEKKDKKDKKDKRGKKEKKKDQMDIQNMQVEDDAVSCDPSKNVEMRDSVLDSGIDISVVHSTEEASKIKRRKKDKHMSDDTNEEVKKKKKSNSKKLKEKAGSGEASADTTEASEPAGRKDKKKTKKNKKALTVATEG